MARDQATHRVRTLFLSDIHLGFKRARARELVEFLRGVEAECIVLAGDIVDALSLAKRFFWTDDHSQVVRALLAKRRSGTRLIYIPGNHDPHLGMLAEMLSGQLEVHREWVHRTARGERLLVVHGDEFDSQMQCSGFLYWLGDTLYYMTLLVNDRVNDLRRLLGRPYLPLLERLKLGIGRSARYIARYEEAAVRYATARGYDGIVCGHIHSPNLLRSASMVYCNTGDWVESCSALIEDTTGELHLLRWPHRGIAAAVTSRGLRTGFNGVEASPSV